MLLNGICDVLLKFHSQNVKIQLPSPTLVGISICMYITMIIARYEISLGRAKGRAVQGSIYYGVKCRSNPGRKIVLQGDHV